MKNLYKMVWPCMAPFSSKNQQGLNYIVHVFPKISQQHTTRYVHICTSKKIVLFFDTLSSFQSLYKMTRIAPCQSKSLGGSSLWRSKVDKINTFKYCKDFNKEKSNSIFVWHLHALTPSKDFNKENTNI